MFSCGFLSYSQSADISVHPSTGIVTCSLSGDALGASKTISGKTYFIVNSA